MVFDPEGLRTQFKLDVLELQKGGLESIGTWDPMDTLNITRHPKAAVEGDRTNVMANRTFVVGDMGIKKKKKKTSRRDSLKHTSV